VDYTGATVVTLTATPGNDSGGNESGWEGWTGCDSTSGANQTVCTVTMSAVKNVSANFFG